MGKRKLAELIGDAIFSYYDGFGFHPGTTRAYGAADAVVAAIPGLALAAPADTSAVVAAPVVSISLEDARQLFDLAVNTPLVCSGSFESDDVVVLRRIAEAIGVDPAEATPDEFIRDFPHAFKPFNVALEREQVDTGEYRQGIGGRYPKTRPETDEEVYARLGTGPDRCSAGSYRRYCTRPSADPIHSLPSTKEA